MMPCLEADPEGGVVKNASPHQPANRDLLR